MNPKPEVNKRLAQTKLPGGKVIEREWTVRERYMLYSSGFRDGAGGKSMDRARMGLGAYDRGYTDGHESRRDFVSAYAEEIGYVPQVLRTTAATPKDST